MLLIRTEKHVYRPEETVAVTLFLRNDGREQREYHFRNAQRFDILIEQAGQKIWQWSDRLLFSQRYTTLLVAPGDHRVFKAEWNQQDTDRRPAPRGPYTVRAWIVGSDEVAERGLALVDHAGNSALKSPRAGSAETAATVERPPYGYYHMLSLHGYPMFEPPLGLPRSFEAEFSRDSKRG